MHQSNLPLVYECARLRRSYVILHIAYIYRIRIYRKSEPFRSQTIFFGVGFLEEILIIEKNWDDRKTSYFGDFGGTVDSLN